jgi:hypothetical protein
MKNYKEFYLSMLFESIFQVDSNFIKILNKISDDPIALKIKELVNKDIETQYNFIQMGDKEDQVYFLPDSQASKASDVWSKKNSAKIGRLVNQILTSQGVNVIPADIERFVNKYKTAWKEEKTPKDPIQLVSGEDIKYWYHVKNYQDEDSGQLGNSCMRYPRCQSFFRIYTDNPDVCQLAILLDDDDKLIGRCLVWKTMNGGVYIDRIYTRHDNDVEFMYNKLIKKFPNALSHYNYDHEEDYISVKLSFDYTDEFKKSRGDVSLEFPYMDSLPYFYPLSGILSTDNNIDGNDIESQFCIKIQSTSGGYDNDSHIAWSKSEGSFIDTNDYFKSGDDWISKDKAVKDVFGNYYLEDELVYSDLYKGLIYKPVETNWGLAPEDHTTFIDGELIPDIFHDNTNFDPDKYPVYTNINGENEFVRNLRKSIEFNDKYLLPNKGIKLLSVTSDKLSFKMAHIGTRKWLVYYFKEMPIGISNIVRSFFEEDIDRDICYLTEEWMNLLGFSDLDLIDNDFYIKSNQKFLEFLTRGISNTGSFKNLIEMEKNPNILKTFNTYDLDTIRISPSELNDEVLEYIQDYFKRVRDYYVPKLHSDTKINWNANLKEEFTKSDLLNDKDFMDYLNKLIYYWWMNMHSKNIHKEEIFNKYFHNQDHLSIMLDKIIDFIYSNVYIIKDFKENPIIESISNEINYYESELADLQLL